MNDFAKILPGKAYPLGASWDGKGVNFSVFSENAHKVELLFFDSPEAKSPTHIFNLPERSTYVWHAYIPGVNPGQLYALRVHGPYEPGNGHRFCPSKLLLDPYAKALAGKLRWSDALFGYRIGNKQEDLSFDDRDSAEFMPKCVVIDHQFDWEQDRPLRIPWNKTVIYETHVKGFTFQNEKVPAGQRGSFLGVASPAAIEHLKNLGVTAVELMPIHQHIDEKALVEKGLKNYWGYNTIAFFAPDSRYSGSGETGGQVKEFKEMVKGLHKAGLEVILDVVYNHTAEGSHLGPTLCFKGIDNASYYNLVKDNPRYYMDFSGCGNSFNMAHPWVLKLIMDSLRYWVTEMHVDGFRFDLASSLAREFLEVDRLSAFFDIIQQDPVLSEVKLIAEPWDLGPSGYQVGNFPPGWAEWNNRYRDTIRSFWKGDEKQIAEFAYRFSGSSDIYQWDRRKPQESINFVTAHDGFTLEDLVSYNQKHNEANQEENKDGLDNNVSWNCGQEGPSEDQAINELRKRQKRNFLATLFLSHGTPMLLGGDEINRTQKGNNNNYAQDNEISWYDWTMDEAKSDFLEFTRGVIRIRNEHAIFRRKKFFQGKIDSKNLDIVWLDSNGNQMKDEQWQQGFAKSLGALLSGEAIDDEDENGNRIKDDTFLVIFNSHSDSVQFSLPAPGSKEWVILLDTYAGEIFNSGAKISQEKLEIRPFSLVLLKLIS